MTIIFLPFLSFLLIIFFGRYIGRKGAIFLTISSTFFSFILAIFLAKKIVFDNFNILVNFGRWFWVGDFSFIFDTLSITMVLLVSFILLLVQIYSLEYMKFDPFLPKFLSYLSFFGGTMMLMVVSSNLLLFFVGWEGVGLSSYLLINFWVTRNLANKSAIKAVLFNRVGDIALILTIMVFYWCLNTTDFAVMHAVMPLLSESKPFLVEIIAFLLFIAAIAKSAQLFLHPWLPDLWRGLLL